jgi:mRNA interferase RelE/StbE
MSCKLEFLPPARKEWDKLGATLREQFKKKLAERLREPHARNR